MKPENRIKSLLLVAAITSYGAPALADMTVDKTNGVLTITSDIDGTINAKVIGPDDSVVVNERFSGNSFSWAPSSGPDGAYRYDVRFSPDTTNTNSNSSARLNWFNTSSVSTQQNSSAPAAQSDYAGGSVEVKNGQIAMQGGLK